MPKTKNSSKGDGMPAGDFNTTIGMLIDQAAYLKKKYNSIDPKTRKKIVKGVAAAAATIAAIKIAKKIIKRKK